MFPGYRNSNVIEEFVDGEFKNVDSFGNYQASKSMSLTRMSKLALAGQKPLWILTGTLDEDQSQLKTALKEATKNFPADVIWTCWPSRDFDRCLPVCQEEWVYANINDMDGIEASTVVIFGMPPTDNVSMDGRNTHSRLFTRARHCLVIVTEQNVPRY